MKSYIYNKKIQILVIILFVIILLSAVRFNPFTPVGALRCKLITQGYILSAMIMDAKKVNPSSFVYKSLKENETLYAITFGTPYESDTATYLVRWLVKKSGSGYVCRYYGWG